MEPGWPRSTRRSRPTPVAASTTRRRRIRADNTPLGFHASVRSPERRVVHRPVLPPRQQRLRQLLRARPHRRPERSTFVEREDVEGDADPLGVGALDVPAGPDVTLRTYRLALLTDPTYSTYFGGPANVTPPRSR